MFYERYEPKKKRRRKRGGCLGRLVKTILLLGAAWLVVMVLSSGVIGDLIDSVTGRSGGLPGGWTNVLLLGADKSNEGSSRTDSIMVASISSGGAVKLTSIMRDTLVDIEGRGAHKINAAYAYGGAELAMRTVNDAFGLNISRYAVIDFAGFADVVDAMGGVTMSITKQEMQNMNKKNGHKLSGYGDNIVLDGVQAVRYSRIRKIDSDYMRASRQRRLIDAMMKKARTIKNPIDLVKVGSTALKAVKTNMNVVELGVMAGKVLASGGEVSQFRVPAEGTYESGTKDGVWSIRADLDSNRALLRKFIYGQ